MMSLGGIDVDAKISELRQDPLRVGHIAIREPKLVIEMKGSEFNIKKFIDQLPAGEPKPADNSEPLKLIINDLQVRGATVVFRPDIAAVSALPGVGDALKGIKQEYTLTIPDLAMQNIGSGEGNQNGAQIKEIVTLLGHAARRQGAAVGPAPARAAADPEPERRRPDEAGETEGR
jgi:hypothetical protein